MSYYIKVGFVILIMSAVFLYRANPSLVLAMMILTVWVKLALERLFPDTAYFNIDKAGWWFWKPNEAWRVGAVLQIRPGAWDEDDDNIDHEKPFPSGFDDPGIWVAASL